MSLRLLHGSTQYGGKVSWRKPRTGMQESTVKLSGKLNAGTTPVSVWKLSGDGHDKEALCMLLLIVDTAFLYSAIGSSYCVLLDMPLPLHKELSVYDACLSERLWRWLRAHSSSM